MRLLLAAFTITALVPNAALASSFVTVLPPQPGATPSIVEVGTAANPVSEIATFIEKLVRLAAPLPDDDPSRMVTVSTSIVSFGAAPPVTMEKVAAIGKRQNLPEPVVMRGGIAGGAFSTPEAAPDVAAVPDEPAQEEAAPGNTIPSAVRGSDDGGATPASGDGMKPVAPPSAPTASAPAPVQPTAQREGPAPR